MGANKNKTQTERKNQICPTKTRNWPVESRRRPGRCARVCSFECGNVALAGTFILFSCCNGPSVVMTVTDVGRITILLLGSISYDTSPLFFVLFFSFCWFASCVFCLGGDPESVPMFSTQTRIALFVWATPRRDLLLFSNNPVCSRINETNSKISSKLRRWNAKSILLVTAIGRIFLYRSEMLFTSMWQTSPPLSKDARTESPCTECYGHDSFCKVATA